jgi:hypothetical protein
MMNRKIPRAAGDADSREIPLLWWNLAAWLLAAGAFVLAAVLSYWNTHYNSPNDLRSPAVLAVNALLALVVAIGYAVRDGSLTRWTDAHFCLRFGLWAAAVFRLVPPIINEDVLYLKDCGTFDAPYVVLGAFVHGGLAALLACPCAIRVLDHRAGTDNDSLLEMCGAVVLVFFIVACFVRLVLAEKWWAGF